MQRLLMCRAMLPLLLLTAAGAGAAPTGQRVYVQRAAKLYPVDEGPQDPSFFTFRKRLLTAVRQHDGRFILSVVHPKIANTFGLDDGKRFFKRKWQPDRAESPLWR